MHLCHYFQFYNNCPLFLIVQCIIQRFCSVVFTIVCTVSIVQQKFSVLLLLFKQCLVTCCHSSNNSRYCLAILLFNFCVYFFLVRSNISHVVHRCRFLETWYRVFNTVCCLWLHTWVASPLYLFIQSCCASPLPKYSLCK